MITISLPKTLEGLLLPLQQAFYAGESVGLDRVTFAIQPNISDEIVVTSGDKRYLIVIDSDVIPFFCCSDLNISDGIEYICFRYWHDITQADKDTGFFSSVPLSHFSSKGMCVDIAYHGQAGQIAERWSMLGSDQSFVFTGCSRFDFSSLSVQQNHLAWFIAALSMKFSLQDCLLIAQAGRKVSRETWVESQFDFLSLESTNRKTNTNSRQAIPPFPPVNINKFNLYPVLDDELLISELIDLGVSTIQLRVKEPNDEYQDTLKRVITKSKARNVQLFVNDDWELALAHDAFGVHLGQEDIITADICRLSHSGVRLGISTHSYFEILRAIQIQPSYIALGHIFPTQTKQMPSLPQGTIRLALYQKFIKRSAAELGFDIATVAIGGINLGNVGEVWSTGVDAVAVVTAITNSTKIDETVTSFNSILMERNGGLNGL
jgi:thiamine-phosphate pyrophosphorylase